MPPTGSTAEALNRAADSLDCATAQSALTEQSNLKLIALMEEDRRRTIGALVRTWLVRRFAGAPVPEAIRAPTRRPPASSLREALAQFADSLDGYTAQSAATERANLRMIALEEDERRRRDTQQAIDGKFSNWLASRMQGRLAASVGGAVVTLVLAILAWLTVRLGGTP